LNGKECQVGDVKLGSPHHLCQTIHTVHISFPSKKRGSEGPGFNVSATALGFSWLLMASHGFSDTYPEYLYVLSLSQAVGTVLRCTTFFQHVLHNISHHSPSNNRPKPAPNDHHLSISAGGWFFPLFQNPFSQEFNFLVTVRLRHQ
jgi:hypothetical protein